MRHAVARVGRTGSRKIRKPGDLPTVRCHPRGAGEGLRLDRRVFPGPTPLRWASLARKGKTMRQILLVAMGAVGILGGGIPFAVHAQTPPSDTTAASTPAPTGPSP